MQDIEIKDKILLATLPHVTFDGWGDEAVKAGAEDAGFDEAMGIRCFPYGVGDILAHFADYINREMSKQLEELDMEGMSIGKRLEEAMKIRLELEAPHKDAVQQAMSYYGQPKNALVGTQMVWKAVDEMWWACGDDAVDFNYYTKRASLAAIYSATMFYWMSDESEDNQATLLFYRNRLIDIVNAIKTRKKITGRIGSVIKKVACFGPRPSLLRR